MYLPEEIWLCIFKQFEDPLDVRRLGCVNQNLMRISKDRSLRNNCKFQDLNHYLGSLFWNHNIHRLRYWGKVLKCSNLSKDFQDVFFVIFESLVFQIKRKAHQYVNASNRSLVLPKLFVKIFEHTLPIPLREEIIVKPYSKLELKKREIKPDIFGMMHYIRDNLTLHLKTCLIRFLKSVTNENNSTIFVNAMAKFGSLFFDWLIVFLEHTHNLDVTKITREELGRVFADYKPLRQFLWAIIL